MIIDEDWATHQKCGCLDWPSTHFSTSKVITFPFVGLEGPWGQDLLPPQKDIDFGYIHANTAPQLLIVYCTETGNTKGKGVGITKQSGDQQSYQRAFIQTPQLYTRMYTHTHVKTHSARPAGLRLPNPAWHGGLCPNPSTVGDTGKHSQRSGEGGGWAAVKAEPLPHGTHNRTDTGQGGEEGRDLGARKPVLGTTPSVA